MGVALALLLVAIASVVFHLLSPWWWTPIASNWQYIDDTIIITFWITGAVFVAIVAFMTFESDYTLLTRIVFFRTGA